MEQEEMRPPATKPLVKVSPLALNLVRVAHMDFKKSKPAAQKPISILKKNTSTFDTKRTVLETDQHLQQKKDQWKKKHNPLLLKQLNDCMVLDKIAPKQVEDLARWNKNDIKANKKALYIKQVQKRNDLILKVVEQSPIEMMASYQDQWPLLECRKQLMKVKIYINMFACLIINNKAFEYSTITVILLNSLTLAFENPADEPAPEMILVEQIFLGLYTFEMCMKILGMGLIFNRGAYLRDFWGMLDFTIVMSAYFTVWNDYQKSLRKDSNDDGEEGMNLNALRAFRVLRPLRTITSIKGLRMLVVSLLSALPMMKQTIIVLFFFFLIFAIGGVQMLQGILKRRCIEITTGKMLEDEEGEGLLCGGTFNCPHGYFCGKQETNPNYGNTNLDNIFYALLMVFQSTTLEGWSDIQTMYQRTYSYYIFLYFIMIVFIGAFFLMNLTLAVINASFTKSQKEFEQPKKEDVSSQKEGQGDNLQMVDGIELQTGDDEKIDSNIGIMQFFLAKRAAKRMIDFLRTRQHEKATKLEQKLVMATRRTELTLKDCVDSPVNASMFQKRLFLKHKAPKMTKKSSMTNEQQKQKFKITSMFAQELKEKFKPEKEVLKKVTEVEDFVDHKEDVKLFLKSIKTVNSDTDRCLLNSQRSQVSVNLAGLHDETRKYAWLQNLKLPQRPISPYPNSRINRVHATNVLASTAREGQNSTIEGFYEDDDVSNSSLREDLQFDNLIPEDGSKDDQSCRDDYHIPDESYSDNFINDETPYMSRYSNGSSIVPADETLEDQIASHREQKQQENAQARYEKTSPPKVTIEARKELLNIQKHMQTLKPEENKSDLKKNLKLEIHPLTQRINRIRWKADLKKQRPQTSQPQNTNDLPRLKRPLSGSRVGLGMTKIKSKISEAKEESPEQKTQTRKKVPIQKSFKVRDHGLAIIIPSKQAGSNMLDQGPVATTPDRDVKKKEQIKAVQQRKVSATHTQKQKLLSYLKEAVDDEFMRREVPKDPFEKFLNKATQKIAITKGLAYNSTSEAEVLEPRIFQKNVKKLSNLNKYIQKPFQDQEREEDYGVFEEEVQRNKHQSYQLKTQYKIQATEVCDDSDMEEDDLAVIPQPYETIMNIGFKQYLTQLSTKFIAKRSDILVSASLSITLTPIEFGTAKRNLIDILLHEDLQEWIDLRQEYRALSISQQRNPRTGFTPGYFRYNKCYKKYKQYGGNNFQGSEQTPVDQIQDLVVPELLEGNLKPRQGGKESFIAKMQTQTQKRLPLCLLREQLSPEQQQILNEGERRMYNMQKAKFDSSLRTFQQICGKKGLNPDEIQIGLHDARKMYQGLYYDDDEDGIDEGIDVFNTKVNTQYLTRKEDFKENTNLHDFEQAATKIIYQEEKLVVKKCCKVQDEIPKNLREEFDLPKHMSQHSLDFMQVRLKDINMKTKRPIWSGQDVLEDSLTYELSSFAVTYMNAIRVWPKGLYGKYQKANYILKVIVKSEFFGNLMTLFVAINAGTMAMEKYNMSDAEVQFSEESNTAFSWIFIAEMSLKLIALGVRNYCSEAMNVLDGTVVLFSILEMSMEFMKQEVDLAQLRVIRSLRVLRTTRVLRIARILRTLKSMQVIIAVIMRSLSQFVYIALLLFVCCFIFALLGKTLFGDKFNYDPKPRGNFDTYNIAFATVFQVLTMENWQTVLFDSMRSQLGKWVPSVFFISWIFIGNFILLNLFLAILLDSFLVEDDAFELTDEEKEEKEETKRLLRAERDRQRKKRMRKLEESLMRSGTSINHNMTPMSSQGNNQGLQKLIHDNNPQLQDLIVDNVDDLDYNTVRNMFLDQGILEDKGNLRREQKMFEDNECLFSFYTFSQKNPFRRRCFHFQSGKLFNNTVMFLICVSSVKLASDTYFTHYDEDSNIRLVNKFIDYFINVMFFVEALIKSIALGAGQEKGSYLRDGWNKLDFFIVVTSFVDMITSEFSTLEIFKVLRLTRALRPLRFISHNQAMKLIVNALIESVGSILNVMVVVVMVWLMFAILAVNTLAGKSFYCSIDMYKNHNKYDCNNAGGHWLVYDSNYDDIFSALMTLFIVSTLEGWPDIMLQSVDAVGVDKGPSYEAQPGILYFYVVFIMVGSFFLLNFFIGVLFLKYSEAKKAEQAGYTPENINWISIQGMVTGARVAHDKANRPRTKWRIALWNVVNSKIFENTIMVFIVLNMIQMACNFEGAPHSVDLTLNVTNYIFTAVFLFECVAKLLVYRYSYFETSWNKFDFFVVIASLVDLALEFVDTEDMQALPIGNIAKVLRVLRVSRVLRLASKSKELQALLMTISMSVGALLNVFSLLVLILCMFAVVGVFFFGELTEHDDLQVLDPNYKNFKQFFSAILLLFGIATGEDWNKVMYDCIDTPPDCIAGKTCGSSLAPVYYICFIMVITHVMLNLFILVIIQQFETFYVADDNPIKMFKSNFDIFHDVWVEETMRFNCKKIRQKDVVDFFKKMLQPMGFKSKNQPLEIADEELRKVVLKMGIRGDNGWIYFNELLYRCLKRIFGDFKLNKKMQIIELKTLFRIQSLSTAAKYDSHAIKSNEDVFQTLVDKGHSVNPFLTMMYYKITFNTWVNAWRRDKAMKKDPTSVELFNIRDKNNLREVFYDVEEIVEYTSEEDSLDFFEQMNQKAAETQLLKKQGLQRRRTSVKFPRKSGIQQGLGGSFRRASTIKPMGMRKIQSAPFVLR